MAQTGGRHLDQKFVLARFVDIVLDDLEWPTWRNGPLDFLVCIDLADLAGMDVGLDLPPAGTLSFFYASEFDDQPWGLHLEDQDGWRVVYTEPGAGTETIAPAGSTVFDRYDLVMEQSVSIPHLNSSSVTAAWGQHRDELITFWDSLFGDLTDHQVGGWPTLQQASFWTDGHYGLLGVPYDERKFDDASLEAIHRSSRASARPGSRWVGPPAHARAGSKS